MFGHNMGTELRQRLQLWTERADLQQDDWVYDLSQWLAGSQLCH
jgi:hypothetical protein